MNREQADLINDIIEKKQKNIYGLKKRLSNGNHHPNHFLLKI